MFFMKKSILGGIFQYGAAIMAVIIAVLYIVAYDNGIMPFSEDETVPNINPDISVDSPAVKPDTPDEDEEVHKITEMEFLASVPLIADDDVINKSVYNGSQAFAKRSVSVMGDLAGARISLVMGYVFLQNADGDDFVFDSEMRDVTDAVSGMEIALCRDSKGRALFFRDGSYYYIKDGKAHKSTYDRINYDKGVKGYAYPSYLAGGDANYTVFGENGLFGLRRNSDGEVVIKAEYADVYAPSEGFVIAVDGTGKMYLYKTDGTLVTDTYRVPKSENNMIGYFFVKNGLFRASNDAGEELLVNTDGVAVGLPSDYNIIAYSDGVLLMKSTDGKYGYFSSKGKWLGTPNYEDAAPFYEGLSAVRRDGLYGMIDTNGNEVIPCVFENISNCQDGVIVAFAPKSGYSVFNKINGKVE